MEKKGDVVKKKGDTVEKKGYVVEKKGDVASETKANVAKQKLTKPNKR